MIIFGTRGVNSTIEDGNFNCPQCECDQLYKHKKVTRFFTLYFIPLIPLGRIGEFVECQVCFGTFIPKVLEYQQNPDSDKFISEYEKAVKHSMVLIMLADGEIDGDELTVVQKIINKYSHNDITLAELGEYAMDIENDSEDISIYLKKITPSLNEHGKESLIKCALAVAAADGKIEDSEIAMIHKMGEVMEMSKAHIRGIFAEVLEPKETSFSDN